MPENSAIPANPRGDEKTKRPVRQRPANTDKTAPLINPEGDIIVGTSNTPTSAPAT
jgi:hypothetical protein